VAVGGGWVLLRVSGDGMCLARADSGDGRLFSDEGSECLFLFGFVYSYLFTVYLCNGLILYGLLSDF
jgi:hypothetical protein